MRILFLGDVFGRPGRQVVRRWLPQYRGENGLDFVIANGENVSGGKGITEDAARELFDSGVDVLTGGNHSFQHRESYDLFERDARFLRPANLPPGAPGRGLGIYQAPNARYVAVINLMGRAFMKPIDCPFRAAENLASEALAVTPILIMDFHAEATSEKIAMAAWMDGRATAVIGTHTHVPTADARISARGTAAITDVGMTGPYDSIIGIETGIVLDQIVKGMPVHHQVAKGDVRISGLQIELNEESGRTTGVKLIQEPDWKR